MVEVVDATDGIAQTLRHSRCVKCRVVWQHVDNHAHSVFFCLGTHCDEFIACAHLIVADGPIQRLIVIVPFAVAHNLLAAAVADKAVVGRRCLHHSEPCVGNTFHIFADCVERPAPGVENCLCVGGAA